MADKEVSELDELQDLADADEFLVTDKDDTTASPDGTSKRILAKNLLFGDLTDIIVDTSSNRPSAGTAGRLFIETDTGQVLYDDGNTWVLVGTTADQISLSSLQSRKHSSLTNINSDDHHTKYKDGQAQDAVGNNFEGALNYDSANVIYEVDINALTSVTPASDDKVLIEDASDSHNDKKTTVQDLVNASSDARVDIADDGSTVLTNAEVIDLAGGFFNVSVSSGTATVKLTSGSFGLSFLSGTDVHEIIADTSGNLPAGGTDNRLFIETDTGRTLFDDGTGWIEVGLSESEISLASLGSLNAGDQAVTGIGLLEVTGSSEHQIDTVTTNTTLDDNYSTVLVDASVGNVTITLPPVSSAENRQYTIKRIDSSSNTVTIDGDGTEKIDGSETQTIANQYDSFTIHANSTQWWVI